MGRFRGERAIRRTEDVSPARMGNARPGLWLGRRCPRHGVDRREAQGRELRNSLGEDAGQVKVRVSIEEQYRAEFSLLYREGSGS